MSSNTELYYCLPSVAASVFTDKNFKFLPTTTDAIFDIALAYALTLIPMLVLVIGYVLNSSSVTPDDNFKRVSKYYFYVRFQY